MSIQVALASPLGPLSLELADDARVASLRFGAPAPRGPVHATDAQRATLAAVRLQLGECWAGRREVFHLPLRLPAGEEFQARAQRALALVPYGTTATYGRLAELAGSPRAARAAGTACATNPLPLFLPCHRIVPAGGGLGSYGGGAEAKRFLLRLEAARIAGGVR